MKRGTIMAAALIMALGAGAASADCAADMARLGHGISKDGSMAPLQGSSTPPPASDTGGTAAAPPAEGEGIAKDGSETPLGANPDIATSGQDAQSQSSGGDTAAAQATGAGEAPQSKEDALAKARAALDAGDEAACNEALKGVM